jgi:hypothetical protein
MQRFGTKIFSWSSGNSCENCNFRPLAGIEPVVVLSRPKKKYVGFRVLLIKT